MLNMAEKIKNSQFSNKLVSAIDSIFTISIPKIFFLLISVLSFSYSSDPTYIWRIELNRSLFYFAGISALLVFFLNLIDKKEDCRDLDYVKKNTFFYLFFIIFIAIISSITLDLKTLFLFFLHNLFLNAIFIFYTYCEVKNTLNNAKYDLICKIFSTFFVVLALLLYIYSGLKDPLLSIVLFCSIPFCLISFFSNKIEMLLFQYRILFFIYVFFMSTTIFPFLFISSLGLFIVSKFYFFVKHDIKYPTFFGKHDTSR